MTKKYNKKQTIFEETIWNSEMKQGKIIPGNAEPQLRINSEFLDLKEWHSRGYLPHLDRSGLLQFITFRLADSLPQEKLKELAECLENMKNKSTAKNNEKIYDAESRLRISREVEKRKLLETWLDAGMGLCALSNPYIAKITQETILKFDGKKYYLLAWCIMPNHVHVLIEPLIALKKIVQSWKSYTGRWVMSHNAELGLRVPGNAFWMPDYWDRYIRNEKHLLNVIEYIHQNPVKVKLCKSPEQWLWSSARFIMQKQY